MNPRILTINGGSSSIKFALFDATGPLMRIVAGAIERVGLPGSSMRVEGVDPADSISQSIAAPDYAAAIDAFMDWAEGRSDRDAWVALGHRVVHGGPKYSQPQRITTDMVEELRRLGPFDPAHLPAEILLIEALSRRFSDLPQVAWLARTENMDAEQFDRMVNFQSGLLGVSQTSSDMRDLLKSESQDLRAAEAVALFCYQVKKWIGAYAAALGGLDTLVFAGGLGENAPPVRGRICEGPGLLGIELDASRNAHHAAVISAKAYRVSVRVIRTDKEPTIARSVARLRNLNLSKKDSP